MSKPIPLGQDAARQAALPPFPLEALFSEPLLEGKQILGLLTEKYFSLESTGIPLRTYHNWHSEGLLPESMPTGKTVQLDLSGFAWLKVVDQLKSFGFGLEPIRQAKAQLFAPVAFQDLLTLFGTHPNTQEEAQKILARSPLPDAEVDHITALLNGGATADIASVSMPLFTLLVVQTLAVKQMTKLLVLSSGQVLPLLDEMQLLDANVQKLTLLPHISLSLYSLLEPLLAEVPSGKTHNLTQSAFSISGEEYSILRTIREGNLNELCIRFDENHLPSVMLGMQGQQVNENNKALLTHLLLDSKHYEVNKKHNYNGQVYVQRTFRKRLRSKSK